MTEQISIMPNLPNPVNFYNISTFNILQSKWQKTMFFQKNIEDFSINKGFFLEIKILI
jgi:hypothetical protein